VVQNALFASPPKKLSSLVMPWCTYTDPEWRTSACTRTTRSAAGIELDTYHVPLSQVNRAVADGEEEGFVRIHTKKGGDEIVGATIVAAHAGEMISEVTLAIVAKQASASSST
jgi:pyruvate/2-oxoglutarate dehydrogenase complex dihydrolipoamide dehydrogenase (E3) component